jgi:hypothetical protein
VTVPDNTRLAAGEKFTKTWKLQNTGSCTWTDYSIAFVAGDKLDAPESVPVPETEMSSTVEVSIDLVAPPEDGAYTGNFELRNAEGESCRWDRANLLGDDRGRRRNAPLRNKRLAIAPTPRTRNTSKR